MTRWKWTGLLVGGLLLFGQTAPAWAQMPLYTKGAVAEKVPGHNLVIIYPDKSPSAMYREQQRERAAYRQSTSRSDTVNVTNNNTVTIENNSGGPTYYPDSYITRVYQVQTPRFWQRQYGMGYTFTGPYGFYRPYNGYRY